MEQGYRLVYDLLCLQSIGAPGENVPLQVDKVDHEVEGCGLIDSEVVEAQNMAFQIDQHLLVEPVVEEGDDVF